MAGRLRAEATLAVANGLFLAFLLVGGILVPVEQLPARWGTLPRSCGRRRWSTRSPARWAGRGPGVGSVVALATWAVGAVVLGALAFQVD